MYIENLEFYPNNPALDSADRKMSLVEQIRTDCTTSPSDSCGT